MWIKLFNVDNYAIMKHYINMKNIFSCMVKCSAFSWLISSYVTLCTRVKFTSQWNTGDIPGDTCALLGLSQTAWHPSPYQKKTKKNEKHLPVKTPAGESSLLNKHVCKRFTKTKMPNIYFTVQKDVFVEHHAFESPCPGGHPGSKGQGHKGVNVDVV